MKSTLVHLIFVLGIISISNLSAQKFPERPQPARQLNDLSTDWISLGQASDLDEALNEFKNKHRIDFVVVLIDSLPGMERRYFTNELGNLWNVGENHGDSALVLMVSRLDRTSFLAVGKPLQVAISDNEASELLYENLVPYFKEKQYTEGLLNTIYAIDDSIITYQENEKYLVRRHLGVLWYLALLIAFLLIRRYAVQGSSSKVYYYSINENYTGTALCLLNALLSYFIFKWNLWVSLSVGAVFGIWFRSVVGAAWFYAKDLTLTIEPKERPPLENLPVSVLYVLYTENNIVMNNLIKQLFFNLLNKGIIQINEESQENAGSKKKSMTVKRGPAYDESVISLENELIIKDLSKTGRLLKHFLLFPFGIYGDDGYLRYFVGKELMAYGFITKQSWFWGRWIFTNDGKEAMKEVKARIAEIASNWPKNIKRDQQFIESLGQYGNLLGLIPGFLDNELGKIFNRKKGKSKYPIIKKSPEELSDEYWYWFWFYFSQLEYLFEDIFEDAVSEYYTYSGSNTNSRTSYSSSSNSYGSSDSSSYSSGSFDGGGGGADW